MSTEREIEQYRIGYANGVRAAVTFLHQQAREMNDPRARDVLNAAADYLGVVNAHCLPSALENKQPVE